VVVAATYPERSIPPTSTTKSQKEYSQHVAIVEKDVMHPPGVEPGPIACVMEGNYPTVGPRMLDEDVDIYDIHRPPGP
jgi:hypothetical protein